MTIPGPQGRTGVRGETGVVGAPGATGPVGYTGPRGETGVKGSTGPVGDTGPQGRTGIRGDTGVQGSTGVVGSQGQTGPLGYTGPRGETGVKGVTGSVGDTGPQGRTGQRGDTGVQGAQGAPGSTGPQGLTGLIGDTLAGHIQLVTGGWMRAGGATAGVLFGETGGVYGIWGRGRNVTQIEISAADGRLRAGRGAAVMDEDGVNIYSATGTYDAAHSLSFKQAGPGGDVRAGYLGGKVQSTRSYLLLKAEGATGQDGDLSLQAFGGFQNPRQGNAGVNIMAACYTGGQPSQASISLNASPDKRNSIYCEAHDGYFGIDGIGLLVGACGETFDVPPGEIWADGAMRVAGVSALGVTGVAFQTERAAGYGKELRWNIGSTGILARFAVESFNVGVSASWNVYAATGQDSFLEMTNAAPIDKAAETILRASAADEVAVRLVSRASGGFMQLLGPQIEALAGMVLADEEGVYAAPAAGKLKALYGLAAGTSDKYWELGGYTGSAALATGYAWVKIDGTLYKLLDRDSSDARYAAFPAGVLTAYGGSSVPSGWLLCDGAAVSRSTYAALFAAIGTTYGGGDGSTTFNLPELRQKFLRGKGTSDTLGAAGGAATHTHAAHGALSHSGAAVADHAALTHAGAAVTAHSTATSKFGTAAGTVVTTATHTVTQPAQHAAQAHTVTQPSAHAAQAHDTPNSEPPYVNVNWIIKV